MSKIDKLPLRVLGLRNIPAVPFQIKGLASTLVRLGLRAQETKQATEGLSNTYTIGGITAPAYPFLFGESGSDDDASASSEEDSEKKSGIGRLVAGAENLVKGAAGKIEDLVEDGAEAIKDLFDGDDSATVESHRADSASAARETLRAMLERDSDAVRDYLEEKLSKKERQPLVETDQASMTGLSLDDPKQFSMSWTTFADIYREALPHLDPWAKTLTDADEASRLFWPTIASYGLPYNLLILKRISTSHAEAFQAGLGDAWDSQLESAYAQGQLYVIDMSIFETIEPQNVDGFERFTPATQTLMRQDPETKELTPISIRVAGHGGNGAQYYLRGEASDDAWLYALQAAKVSITVWGIWLGHVYHWHIVTASMQMTMYNNLSDDHPLYALLEPQSQFLISFDDILLILWESVAPPTSIASGYQFLELCNTFAEGRDYFDDDPLTTLERLGLREKDFTRDQPWDLYPLVAQLLAVWKATEEYVQVFVDATYPDDAAVADDEELQAWMDDAGNKREGNIRGLPEVDSKAALTRVLTSLIYRITVHGNSRLADAANPGLTFVANYPPTLQTTRIPEPSATISTQELLEALPKTGTIGKMMTFYFTFSFSAPYESFMPLDGITTDLFFEGGLDDPRNRALVGFRQALLDFMTKFQDGSPQVHQWPRNIET